jgi:formylglycine-generating enzyme required for sulfatase activity
MPIPRMVAIGVLCAAACLGCAQQVQPLPSNPQAGTPWENSIGMKLVWIPPEDVREDKSDRPIPRVAITRGFYMGTYEVTQKQYQKVMGTNPSGYHHSDCPVESVTWDEAVEFCVQLSAMEGRTYRLPTEAQWEYACRAGTTTAYFFGDDDKQIDRYAWTMENTPEFTPPLFFVTPFSVDPVDVSPQRPQPVGKKLPNGWGLYDLYGNVGEWCQDLYEPNRPQRVLRGGSYEDDGRFDCRSDSRGRYSPDGRSSENGFRVIMDTD